ncbi:CinA family protein [Roseobacter sp.]|uniref:CinA family protein n=1 Tax=Roseobacter sp. TaxID=1907202 RepID=UPI0032968585
MSLAAQVIAAAKTAGKTVTAAESCTGGMITAALTDVAGASAVIERGFVTYSNAAKEDMLGVSARTLAAHGAVSQEVAAEMAQGARAHARADIAVSVTGIAGPGGSDHKPEGRVCFGISGPNGVATQTVEFGALGRSQVRAAACDHALQLVLAQL